MAGFPGSLPAMIASMLGLPAQDRRHLLEAVGILVRATMARGRRGAKTATDVPDDAAVLGGDGAVSHAAKNTDDGASSET